MTVKEGTPNRQPGEQPDHSAELHRLINRGARLLGAGRAHQALPVLQEAHGLAPHHPDVCINLGGAYILLGQHRKAVPILQAACEAAPGNPMLWMNLAVAHLGNPILATAEQQELAIAALERTVDLNPATPNAYYNLGLIYVDRQQWDRAHEAFRNAAMVNPNDRDACTWLERLANRQNEAPGELHSA
ncbi:MAG: tetratricopeptide repeat protein [Chloroflexi bacterium]|nr:tetratricopeptide repeat protein [Chloroflexota bacterium]